MVAYIDDFKLMMYHQHRLAAADPAVALAAPTPPRQARAAPAPRLSRRRQIGTMRGTADAQPRRQHRCISTWPRCRRATATSCLISTVVPRPIALATTVDADGQGQCRAVQLFQRGQLDPAGRRARHQPGDGAGDGYKDTERNIRDTGEFVVNLVDEALAERMNICAVDFPAEIGELERRRADPGAVGRGQAAAHRRVAGQLRMQAHHRPVARRATRRSRSGGSSTSISATI